MFLLFVNEDVRIVDDEEFQKIQINLDYER